MIPGLSRDSGALAYPLECAVVVRLGETANLCRTERRTAQIVRCLLLEGRNGALGVIRQSGSMATN